MEKLKRLLFEKAYQAEQLRGSYTPGTLEAETWSTTHRVLIDLIYQAELNEEYQRYVSNQRSTDCLGFLILGFLIALLLVWAPR